MTKRRSKHTGRRTVSLLLALVMLIGILPQLILPARADLGGIYEGTRGEIDYWIFWSEDTWGKFGCNVQCQYCSSCYHEEYDDGDWVEKI